MEAFKGENCFGVNEMPAPSIVHSPYAVCPTGYNLRNLDGWLREPNLKNAVLYLRLTPPHNIFAWKSQTNPQTRGSGQATGTAISVSDRDIDKETSSLWWWRSGG